MVRLCVNACVGICVEKLACSVWWVQGKLQNISNQQTKWNIFIDKVSFHSFSTPCSTFAYGLVVHLWYRPCDETSHWDSRYRKIREKHIGDIAGDTVMANAKYTANFHEYWVRINNRGHAEIKRGRMNGKRETNRHWKSKPRQRTKPLNTMKAIL